MDTPMLIDPYSAALPAPIWFVQFFKWLGFTLHTVPMNLWYAGLLVALGLRLGRNAHGRRFASRFWQQMPVLVALGVNFGVVPLLFIQLAWPKVFYPATILMAWHWLAIIGLLIPAYYGVYIYAGQFRAGVDVVAGWRTAVGWTAAVFFVVIGFLFANGLSLMDHVGRWSALWNAHGTSAAALGTPSTNGDPTLWPRWLLMFGLALGTTAVWVLVDAFFLAGKTSDDGYRQWAVGFARKLYTVGMVWASAAGAWYVFGTWTGELRAAMFQWPMAVLTVATAIAPAAPWALLLALDRRQTKRAAVAVIALAQFGVLGINAASRQVVQEANLKLGNYLDISAQPVDVEWGPMAMFLMTFLLGMGAVAWMLWQVKRIGPPNSD